MNRLSRLSLGQRVVLAVGLAAMLLFIGDDPPARAPTRRAPRTRRAPGPEP